VEREIAALFLDIEGCTRLCEDLPPPEMNEVFEAYFAEFLDVVCNCGGDVTEILGDGFLALFEGGDMRGNVAAAFRAAVEIRDRTGLLNPRRADRHEPITVNVGLNAGRALVGFTRLRGQAGERWVYAATGPVTNVAARLCALATHGQILTTKAAAQLLPGAGRCRPLGPRALKNVTGPVEVVEILPPDGAAERDTGGRTDADG
jgi:class 3 adenylate cyclase